MPDPGFTSTESFDYTISDSALPASATITVTVNAVGGGQPPVASFTYQCKKRDCTFDGTGSTDPDGDIASYDWAFGDGNTGTVATTSHTYTNFTEYTVDLTVTDALGNAATATATFTLLDQNKPVKGSASSDGGGDPGGGDTINCKKKQNRDLPECQTQ
jgi:PKD repeat protein